VKINVRDLGSSAFWLALSVFAGVLSIRIGIGSLRSPGPGLFIFLSCFAMGLFSIVGAVMSLIVGEARQEQGIIELWKGKRWHKVVLIVSALTAYALLLPALGFVITSFIIMTLLFILTGVRRLWICVGAALLTVVVSHVVFVIFLRIPLPRGMLNFMGF
jgi:putative tricarboxylic transport membrane protein